MSKAPDELQSLKADPLRKKMRAAGAAIVAVMEDLDALGHGKGEAIALADEARELMGQVEDVHFKTTSPRTTEAVQAAVDAARRVREARR